MAHPMHQGSVREKLVAQLLQRKHVVFNILPQLEHITRKSLCGPCLHIFDIFFQNSLPSSCAGVQLCRLHSNSAARAISIKYGFGLAPHTIILESNALEISYYYLSVDISGSIVVWSS